jgi:hypothetical protein
MRVELNGKKNVTCWKDALVSLWELFIMVVNAQALQSLAHLDLNPCYTIS